MILHYASENKMPQDPVCGMTVSEKGTEFKSNHEDKTFYFCSAQCKKAFDANPYKYARQQR